LYSSINIWQTEYTLCQPNKATLKTNKNILKNCCRNLMRLADRKCCVVKATEREAKAWRDGHTKRLHNLLQTVL